MQKLSMKHKLGYGTGDLASNLVFQLSVIFLLFFYTDVMGISAFSAGIIFLVARIWDAVNDPAMGLIMDRTRSKHGKARVYLKYGSIPLAIATILMFYVPNLSTEMKVYYAGATYILWGMCFTMVNIPYSALTSMMTCDPQERTALSSIRMIFMLIGVLAVSLIAEPLSGAFETPQKGYLIVAVLFSLSAYVFFQVCFYLTKTEKMVEDEGQSQNSYEIKDIVPLLKSNRELLIISVASLFSSIAVFMRETSAIYYVTYNMGNKELLPVFLGTIVFAMVIGNLIIPKLTERHDKKGTYIIGSVVAIIGSMLVQVVPATNHLAIFALAAVGSMGFAAISTLGWAMVSDTVEYGEYKSGVRSEGIVFAVYSFSQKLATALAGFLVAFVLEISGYQAGVTVQSTDTLKAILSTLTFIPSICVFVSLIVVRHYSIDRSFFEKIIGSLQKSA